MELLYREREWREGRWQRMEGKGPTSMKLERSTETTFDVASQLTPSHLHGVTSLLSDHEDRDWAGSDKPSLACRRMVASWFRDRLGRYVEERHRRRIRQ
jgi:glutathione S-transferase